MSYDFKVGYASVDYSVLFGEETAHRFIGNLSGTLNLGKWWVFNSVALYPSFNILYGNNAITRLRITQEQLSEELQRQYQLIIDFNSLTRNQRIGLIAAIQSSFEEGNITRERRDQLFNTLATASTFTDEEIAELQLLVNEGFEVTEFEDGNSFGLMNYSFSIPLSFSSNRLNILLSYTYSIPVKLPGEFFEVDPIGYFAASISYRIPFK